MTSGSGEMWGFKQEVVDAVIHARNLLAVATAAPVAVPDKWPEKLTWSHHDDMTQAEVLAWNNAIDACRNAMLQGADGTLIGEGTRNHPEDNLDMVDHSGDANEKGNSPVIPDGWVACSERMPEPHGETLLVWCRHSMQRGYYGGGNWWVIEGRWTPGERVTHWIPLPAVPEQEV